MKKNTDITEFFIFLFLTIIWFKEWTEILCQQNLFLK